MHKRDIQCFVLNCRKAIDCAVYNSAKAKGASVFIESKEIPFPLVGATSADLVATYGTELDTGDKTWSGMDLTLILPHNSHPLSPAHQY